MGPLLILSLEFHELDSKVTLNFSLFLKYI